MNTTGHYACSSRPRSEAEQRELAAKAAALFAKTATALGDMERDLRGAVVKSRLTPAYDVLAGLDAGDGAMDTTETNLEVNVAGEHIRTGKRADRPLLTWVRGTCPTCKNPVVANSYYVGGKGYQIVHECWESLGENPTCNYRHVL